MSTTKMVAEYVYNTSFDDFGDEVIDKAKALCLSTLGMAVAGSRIHAGRILADYARSSTSTGECSVLGAGFHVPVELAALVNATAAHSTELEDDSWPESMYSCHIIPAVFALGQKLHASGRSILEAFIIGYEVQARPGMIVSDGGASARGNLTAPHLGTIGVAAAAAKLLGLSINETVMAISLAVSQASGSTRQMGTGAHVYEAGIAARNGICAATLAKLGLNGDPTILEGPKGYFDALAGRPDVEFSLGTGADLRVMEIGFKKYPACYLMQRIIDGVIELVTQHDLAADDVESVVVEVNPTFPEIIKFREPSDGDESRFSLTHCVAAALLREDLSSMRIFSDQGIHDHRLRAQWNKTWVIVNPQWKREILGELNPLTITMKSGQVYEKICVISHGDPGDPLSNDEVKQKYMRCVEGIIPDAKAHEAADLVFGLERLDSVGDLLELLTYPAEI